jgi:hypothetical protein
MGCNKDLDMGVYVAYCIEQDNDQARPIIKVPYYEIYTNISFNNGFIIAIRKLHEKY